MATGPTPLGDTVGTRCSCVLLRKYCRLIDTISGTAPGEPTPRQCGTIAAIAATSPRSDGLTVSCVSTAPANTETSGPGALAVNAASCFCTALSNFPRNEGSRRGRP